MLVARDHPWHLHGTLHARGRARHFGFQIRAVSSARLCSALSAHRARRSPGAFAWRSPGAFARRIPTSVQQISIADLRGAAARSSRSRLVVAPQRPAVVRTRHDSGSRRLRNFACGQSCPDGMAIARCPAMQNLRILACVVVALGSLMAAGCGSSDNNCDADDIKNGNCTGSGTVAVVRVENQSRFAVKEVHVAAVGSTTWGTNLVSGAVLVAGGSATLAVTCGHYDVLLIDAAGEQCTLHDVDLCANNADWLIASTACPTFTNQDP
jgi:hypothetical protein